MGATPMLCKNQKDFDIMPFHALYEQQFFTSINIIVKNK